MAHRKSSKKKSSPKRASKHRRSTNYIKVTSVSYGKALRGTPIYWEGRRPTKLKDDGRTNLGKNILELLGARFDRFRWIITQDTTSITVERGIARVRTSQKLLSRMGSDQFDRSRDIKNDIIRKFFSKAFPDYFKEAATPVYVAGTLAKTISLDVIPRLSSQDKEALNGFIPEYIASESLGTVNKLKAKAQIESLRAWRQILKGRYRGNILNHGGRAISRATSCCCSRAISPPLRN
jgi:hypothetical protein